MLPLTTNPRVVRLKFSREGWPDDPYVEQPSMKTTSAFLALALCFAGGAVECAGQSPEAKCPVVIDQLMLSYNHEGGRSVPQLKVWFENQAGKQVSTVTFSLSVLDSGGYRRPYPHSLKSHASLDSGKKKESAWELTAESVDIHGTGETVAVTKIEFADASTWTDDGSESCALTVDFHPK
jgi:hypothetical protein